MHTAVRSSDAFGSARTISAEASGRRIDTKTRQNRSTQGFSLKSGHPRADGPMFHLQVTFSPLRTQRAGARRVLSVCYSRGKGHSPRRKALGGSQPAGKAPEASGSPQRGI